MASNSKPRYRVAMHCVGCGIEVTHALGKRSLTSDSSCHVLPLWHDLFEVEIENRKMELDVVNYIPSPKMCRKCFILFERCKDIIDKVKGKVKNAVEVFLSSITISNTSAAPGSRNARPYPRHCGERPQIGS